MQAEAFASWLVSLAALPATSQGGVYSSAQANTNAGAIDPGIGAFVTSSGVESGTASGYSVNARFIGWTTGVASYKPAPGVAASWTNTANVLGPVAGANGHIISLGDLNPTHATSAPGYITLTFAGGIRNGPARTLLFLKMVFWRADGCLQSWLTLRFPATASTSPGSPPSRKRPRR